MTDRSDTSKQPRKLKHVPTAVDVHGGVPDSAAEPSKKRLPVLLAIYAFWMLVLVYMWLGAR